jgi:hypothetical protein
VSNASPLDCEMMCRIASSGFWYMPRAGSGRQNRFAVEFRRSQPQNIGDRHHSRATLLCVDSGRIIRGRVHCGSATAALRHGVPAVQGRGIDLLPAEATASLAEALVCSLEIAELQRGFRLVNQALRFIGWPWRA